MRVIEEKLIKNLTEESKKSPRKRAIFRFHEYQEPIQRMVNAIRPESYVRPHKHQNPDKVEGFVILKGKVAILRFDNKGKVLQAEILDEKGPVYGVDIPAGEWHMMIALKRNSVVYEVIQGPYNEKTHKKFAPWAPAEENKKKAAVYLIKLKEKLHFN